MSDESIGSILLIIAVMSLVSTGACSAHAIKIKSHYWNWIVYVLFVITIILAVFSCYYLNK